MLSSDGQNFITIAELILVSAHYDNISSTRSGCIQSGQFEKIQTGGHIRNIMLDIWRLWNISQNPSAKKKLCCVSDIYGETKNIISRSLYGYDYYPRPVLAFGYCHRLRLYVCPCVRVCVCINHLLVRTITHQPFKLESPNLNQRCKTPWLRCLLFLGMIDLDLQGKILLESRILPHSELVCTITFHPFKLESPNLDQNAS